jgi:hypothetical protein
VTIRRSLFLHAPLRRTPHDVLTRMLDLVDADTPATGPDGPVAVLERRIATLLGTEAALFFPSGTMAQQVAPRIHAERRGRWAVARSAGHADVPRPSARGTVRCGACRRRSSVRDRYPGVRLPPVGARSDPVQLRTQRRREAMEFSPDEVVGLIHRLLPGSP